MNSKISSDHTEDTIRLSKRMAQLGLCSRREADGHIEQGWVTVNGKTTVLGQKVSPADRIELNKKAHEQQAARYHPAEQTRRLCQRTSGKRL